jgi:hypothetical protein
VAPPEPAVAQQSVFVISRTACHDGCPRSELHSHHLFKVQGGKSVNDLHACLEAALLWDVVTAPSAPSFGLRALAQQPAPPAQRLGAPPAQPARRLNCRRCQPAAALHAKQPTAPRWPRQQGPMSLQPTQPTLRPCQHAARHFIRNAKTEDVITAGTAPGPISGITAREEQKPA